MEEENDLSISQTISAKTLNPRSQKKHAAMIERLSNLHQSRLNQSISRRSDADSSAPFESTQAFLNRFTDSKQSIESELDRLRFISNDLESNPQLKSDLEKLSIAIADLEKLVAENSYFLPSYEVRSTLKAIAELKESLESVNLKLVPRKKFSFRNKPAKKDPANAVNESEISAKESNFHVKGGDDAASAEKSRFETRDSPGFWNEVGAVLVKQFQGFESGDFTLSNLESCEIRLKGRLRALFVHRLRNCRVFVGPVLGSVLIEEAEGCLFMLASHQIRIHHAKATDFYLRVRSRPIIEDCSSVRFAPYLLVYEGIEEELRESGLAEDTGNWANVDDFRWLRAVQSPNWCILPKEEQEFLEFMFAGIHEFEEPSNMPEFVNAGARASIWEFYFLEFQNTLASNAVRILINEHRISTRIQEFPKFCRNAYKETGPVMQNLSDTIIEPEEVPAHFSFDLNIDTKVISPAEEMSRLIEHSALRYF